MSSRHGARRRAIEGAGRGALTSALKVALRAPRSAAAPPAQAENILLLRVDRVGDLIVSTPAIHAIRRKFPQARIAVLASRGNAQVLKGNPDVDEVWPLTLPGLPGILWRLRSCSWDIAADLNAAPSFTSGFLTRWTRAKVRVSFEKKNGELFYDVRLPVDNKAHRAEEAMKVARWLGADASDLAYKVYPGPEDEAAALAVLNSLGWPDGRKWVAVHPGNIKKFDTRWPEENFAALCGRLMERSDLRVLMMKGPDEDPLIEDILSRMKAKPPVAPALPLMPTASLLRKMDLVVCNSTSTLHLAAAVGAPTLSFLSLYNAACWRAQGPQHRALVSDSWETCRTIPVEAALKAAQDIL